jgi:tyrosyl-tRNA synthetase
MHLDEQLAYLTKGAAEIIRPEELRAKLERAAETKTPLRVYLGVDPTAPDIHLGHTVVLRKLKHFQDLGHTAIFLIGDFSAMIGDPTGQSETRPPLTREQVEANARTYLEQVYKILDRGKTEVRYNSEWLGKMSSYDVVRLCGRYRLARMLEREDFRSRLENQRPISVHELLYPLLTAMDAVELRSDVELGATEQKFNILVHREIQREYGLAPQVVLTLPILEGLDGVQKMSKSLANYVGINESPAEIFGKVMSISDELMWRYYELLTDLAPREVEDLRAAVDEGKQHPLDVKKALAKRIVTDFHDEEAATQAQSDFEVKHAGKGVDPNAPLYTERVPSDYVERLDERLVKLGLCSSKSDAQRHIKAGSVKITCPTNYSGAPAEQWVITMDPAHSYKPKIFGPESASVELYFKVGGRQARVKFVFDAGMG